MFTSRNTYSRNKLVKLSLNITLLFSVLTFSGCISNLNLREPQVSLTELGIRLYERGKKAISYRSAWHLFHKNTKDLTRFYIPPFNQTVVLHNRQCQVKLAYLTKLHWPGKAFQRHFPLKTIPASSKEDFFLSSLG